jgi:hypothetical protein
MAETLIDPAGIVAADRLPSHRDALAAQIDRAAKLLPIPGPIAAFAFLNTLEALEDLPFDEGVQTGSRLYGAEPYLPLVRYHERLARGRIRPQDLSAVLLENLGDRADVLIGSLGTRYELRLAMLQHPILQGTEEELRWYVAEAQALAQLPQV